MQLDIKKYSPQKYVSKFIDGYWSIKNISSKDVEIPIVPDGCMDIIFQERNIFLIGAMSEGIIIKSIPNEYTFGVRFKPSILPQILNINASDFTDKKVPLVDISLELFNDFNFEDEDEIQKVKKLDKVFEKQIVDIKINQNILSAIDLIKQYQGNIQINELEKQLNLSSRQIERLFQNFVGYSPKKFCNITRFFTLFKEVIKTNISNYSLKAYDYGYCDQSHLNKEFKKFANFTPTDEIMSVFYNTTS